MIAVKKLLIALLLALGLAALTPAPAQAVGALVHTTGYDD